MSRPSVGPHGIELVVMDIDGTVRSAEDPRGEAVRGALDDLDAARIPWTFSTGRPFGSMVEATIAFDERGPVPACSTYNGAVLWNPRRPAMSRALTLPPARVAHVMGVARHLGLPAAAFSCRLAAIGFPVERVTLGGAPADPDADAFWRGIPTRHEDGGEHEVDVVSVVLGSHDAPTAGEVARMQALLGRDVLVSSSGYRFLEVSRPGVSKGSTLHELSRCYGVGVASVLAIGDGLNDVEMLRVAGLGVAVANAAPEARGAADHVTRGEAGHGVAEAIADLLAGRTMGRRKGFAA